MNRTPRNVNGGLSRVKARAEAQRQQVLREQAEVLRLTQNKRLAAVALVQNAVEKADQADGVRRNAKGQRVDAKGRFVKVN